jgi:hypothetical protein
VEPNDVDSKEAIAEYMWPLRQSMGSQSAPVPKFTDTVNEQALTRMSLESPRVASQKTELQNIPTTASLDQ